MATESKLGTSVNPIQVAAAPASVTAVSLATDLAARMKPVTNPAGARAASFLDSGGLVHMYVDAVNGRDTNDGLTSGTPIQNPTKIRDIIATISFDFAFVQVHLAPNGTLPQNYVLAVNDVLWSLGGSAYSPCLSWTSDKVPAALATGPTTAALDVTPCTEVTVDNASGSATALRTRLNFVTAAPGWTPGDMTGRDFLVIKRAGVPLFSPLPISGNDANHIWVDTSKLTPAGCPFFITSGGNGGLTGNGSPFDLLATDTVQIVRNGAVIVPSGISGNSLALFGLNGNGPELGVIFAGGPPTMQNIDLSGLPFMQSNYPIVLDNCNLPGELNASSGCALVNCALREGVLQISGPGAFPNAVFSAGYGSVINAGPSVSIAMYRSSQIIGFGGIPFLGGDKFGLNQPASIAFALPVGMWQCWVEGGVNNPQASGAIRVAGPGSFALFLSSLIGDMDTTIANPLPSSPAIKTSSDGKVYVPNPTQLGLTGDPSTGDLQVGTGAAIYYGTTTGLFMEAAGFNGNFTRRLEGTATAPTGDTSCITTLPVV